MTELTPSKITAWLDCSWYLTLQREAGEAERNQPGALAQLLMQKGIEHEEACLREFEDEGRTIFRTPEKLAGESFDQWTARIGDPMAESWDVIYQYPLAHDGMRGVADFLVRVEEPRAGFSVYEPYDAKLSRKEAKPGHVLQLCFYAEALAALTGSAPREVHLWLGSGQLESLDVEQFAPYWRRLRRQLRTVMDGPVHDGSVKAEPCSHCEFCEYSLHCETEWRSADSLVFVAGITKKERDASESAGVRTLAGMASDVDVIPGLRAARQDRLRNQAALQVESREDTVHPPNFAPVPLTEDPVWGHGFDHLPRPDDGDVYFDLEGHPFWTPAAGLFFLFGLWYRRGGEWVYDARWAHDLKEQEEVAAGVVEFLHHRRSEYPDFHVYHFNHTERSSMTSMTMGTPSEALFTHLQQTGLFVDLRTVVINSFQVGVESYGLKHLEKLAGFERHKGIEEGAGAVVDYERFMRGGDSLILDAIASYNRDDVMATQALHAWLLDQRGDGLEWRAAVIEEFESNPEVELLASQLLEFEVGSPEHLLGDLLGYWRRERSAEWGPQFERLKAETHELLESPDVIAGLTLVEFREPEGRQEHRRAVFAWPEQVLGEDLKSGSAVLVAGGTDRDDFSSIGAIDRDARTLSLSWKPDWDETEFSPHAVIENEWVDPRSKADVLTELARDVLALPDAGAPNPVSMALIARELPHFESGHGPTDAKFTHEVVDMRRWVGHLDSSYVAVQGPPGTGKTFRGAHLIHELVTSGKRVGICAMSHAAIDNLLEAVHEVFDAKQQLDQLAASRKVATMPVDGRLARVRYTTANSSAANGRYNVVAGTTWFFASGEMRNAPVDVLIIDEAGQLALADAVAASGAARNVLLLGDPLQLAHVSKATHPDGSGASALGHVLGDEVTVDEERGVFLAESWRMHPSVCGFISSQFYEDRLSSHPACAHQRIEGVDPGLVWLEATHAGRSTESVEEAEIVSSVVRDLVGREWTDREGKQSFLRAEDFMVVAPYNDQVRLLRAVLDIDPLTSDVQVGTVDKFQGREAPVVIFTMATSTGEDMPRGPEFLFSRNRLNVAVSRAQCLAVLVCTEGLLDARAMTVEDMRLIGTLSSFVECARTSIVGS